MGGAILESELIGGQYLLAKYQSVCKEQRTEKAPCRPFRTDESNTVHIPAAKKTQKMLRYRGFASDCRTQ